MCALYVRCALSVLQKERRKVWGARYRSENTVLGGKPVQCHFVHCKSHVNWPRIDFHCERLVG